MCRLAVQLYMWKISAGDEFFRFVWGKKEKKKENRQVRAVFLLHCSVGTKFIKCPLQWWLCKRRLLSVFFNIAIFQRVNTNYNLLQHAIIIIQEYFGGRTSMTSASKTKLKRGTYFRYMQFTTQICELCDSSQRPRNSNFSWTRN
jgi:hypothetical protein